MNSEKWKSIAKGAGIAAAGAVLTYLADAVVPSLRLEGSGASLAVAAVMSVVVNAARKHLFP